MERRAVALACGLLARSPVTVRGVIAATTPRHSPHGNVRYCPLADMLSRFCNVCLLG
jgi:hypothetical protein